MLQLCLADLAGDDCRIVVVTGVVDFGTIGRLESYICSLADAGHTRLVLDLSGVRLCDAVAMGRLVRTSGYCLQLGGWLHLAAPTGMVALAFGIVSFGRNLPIYATVAAAAAGDDP